jgi:hypothetical protein
MKNKSDRRMGNYLFRIRVEVHSMMKGLRTWNQKYFIQKYSEHHKIEVKGATFLSKQFER